MSPYVMAQLFITGFFIVIYFFVECLCLLTKKGERKVLCLDKLSCTQKCCQQQEYCRTMATVGVTVLFSLYIPAVLCINK